MHSNSVHQSTSSWWVVGKFVDSMGPGLLIAVRFSSVAYHLLIDPGAWCRWGGQTLSPGTRWFVSCAGVAGGVMSAASAEVTAVERMVNSVTMPSLGRRARHVTRAHPLGPPFRACLWFLPQHNDPIGGGNRFWPMGNKNTRHVELLNGVVDQLFSLDV